MFSWARKLSPGNETVNEAAGGASQPRAGEAKQGAHQQGQGQRHRGLVVEAHDRRQALGRWTETVAAVRHS